LRLVRTAFPPAARWTGALKKKLTRAAQSFSIPLP
jgi:hypothetical protein